MKCQNPLVCITDRNWELLIRKNDVTYSHKSLRSKTKTTPIRTEELQWPSTLNETKVPDSLYWGKRPVGLSWVSHSTLIYTSELILCSTICVHSGTRHSIHMYPHFLFAAIHYLKSSPTSFVRPRSSVGRVTADLIRRSWVRFPHRSKEFFLYLVWFPDSLYQG